LLRSFSNPSSVPLVKRDAASAGVPRFPSVTIACTLAKASHGQTAAAP